MIVGMDGGVGGKYPTPLCSVGEVIPDLGKRRYLYLTGGWGYILTLKWGKIESKKKTHHWFFFSHPSSSRFLAGDGA